MRALGIVCVTVAFSLATAGFAPGEDQAAGASSKSEAAAKSGATYPDTAAAQHAGEEATVQGKVVGVSTSSHGNTYLNFGDRFPKQTFSGVILGKDAEKLKDAKQFEGKIVAVTGKIEMRNEKPQIVISSPAQIKVVEEAGAGTATASQR